MAFILVQHLDPTHESMMVELLAGHTAMLVQQATDGMPIERDHVYTIPPGTYLSVHQGVLRLSQPQERHGARLPFDFLLRSLADDCKERAICVVLSGTGNDGSHGQKAVKEEGGLVVVQDPEEAAYGGMPRSAIAAGAADFVLPIAKMPEAILKYRHRLVTVRAQSEEHSQKVTQTCLKEIIELLRTKASHDFAFYKDGTLLRRIERRMALAAIESDNMQQYIEVLRSDAAERDRLIDDLLINVTSFFRDPEVFEFLAKNVVPDLVRNHPADLPLRIWIAGCSTGEETYSLAMLFREEIISSKSNIKLQIFASDVDADAVAVAREGLYPETIEATVSPARLARFFTKEHYNYRIIRTIRDLVVFTVQDVLADPPFSRVDFVSCRNLLIYLRPDAQTKVISAFHFALRAGGLLLLGSSETVGDMRGRFELVSKTERLYRQVGPRRLGEFFFSKSRDGGVAQTVRGGEQEPASHHTALADLCIKIVTETYMPAAVLINAKNECVYYMGPVDRYLKIVPGRPLHDLLAMAREGLRIKLRSAIQRARQEDGWISIPGGQVAGSGGPLSFRIAVQRVVHAGEALMLVCFIDEPTLESKREIADNKTTIPRVAELERELDFTRAELEGAIHNLEISSDEQKAINEEALSVNEEFQSANEELLTSKEELQSLNEELTALNGQLLETLELHRRTSNDLQNVLYSADVATLFLDVDFNIRFFTPAVKSFFHIIPGDVGRPLADLSPLAKDAAFLEDAHNVLSRLAPVEREIEAQDKAFYIRRILPYRTQDGGVEGIVITFTDVTERRNAADALETAKRQAQIANIAKSRFLAAASHDLRQPLQTLNLLRAQLAKTAEGESTQKLIARLQEGINSMSGMLNTLLDVSQIEAGTIRIDKTIFQVSEVLQPLSEEFSFHAEANGISLRAVPCSLSIQSDPRLLEQMIRNLLSNALKFTKQGKVLIGCRRRAGVLSIEVWDTGIGIPETEFDSIFEEFHQLESDAPQQTRGFGLGLSIVQRLGNLLDHRISVRSRLGMGSVFAVELKLPLQQATFSHERRRLDGVERRAERIHRTGAILIVEDDPEMRELLELLLKEEGHHIAAVSDGAAAIELIARGGVKPDLILSDYNLSNKMNGLQVTTKLREMLKRQIPVIILTGDTSTETLREIARHECVRLNKPVQSHELSQVIQRILPTSQSAGHARIAPAAESAGGPATPVIYVVDDNSHLREAMRVVLEQDGRIVETFSSCESFLDSYRHGRAACLVIDACLPGMSGLELLQRLHDEDRQLPSIMITGNSDVSMAVSAMKAGASDFIEKPVDAAELLASIAHALEQSQTAGKRSSWRESAVNRVSGLTHREREIMDLVVAGHPSKIIAADLGISQRTVENHRATIMKKTASKSLPALARVALAAAWTGNDEPPE